MWSASSTSQSVQMHEPCPLPSDHRQSPTDQIQLPGVDTPQTCGLSIHTHTHLFNGPMSRTTRVSCYQKYKTNLDFTGARDSEWQWHQMGHMQVCNSLQTDNHVSTPPLSFLQAGCPSCCPANSVRALKAKHCQYTTYYIYQHSN